MKRYAFIDVSNTNGTTRSCLGFIINWEKLYKFLTNEKWECEKVFFYKGHKGEKEKKQLEKLEDDIGFIVKTKFTHVHPDRIIDIPVKCDDCEKEIRYKHIVHGSKKSNCDVELTVDMLEVLSEGDEALIFTGDGDFTYLIKTLRDKGVTILIISSRRKDSNGNKRFSTRLVDILKEEGETSKRVRFIDINRWRYNIEKRNNENRQSQKE